MKLHYRAFSPPDDGKLVAEGDLDLPDDADLPTTHDALKSAVEAGAVVDDGAPVRVITDTDVWYTWDHGS